MAQMRTALGVPISYTVTHKGRNEFFQWVYEVWEGLLTTLVGMKITSSHFFVKRHTVQYPHATIPIAERSRQRVHVDIDLCGGCMQCDRICPVGIIDILAVKPVVGVELGTRPNGKRRPLHMANFTIDHSKCLYCGLCTTVCNDDAIYMITDYHFSTGDRDNLFVNYSKYSVEERDAVVAAAAAEKAAKAAAPKPAPAPKPAIPAAPIAPVGEANPEAPKEELFSDKCPGPDDGGVS